MFGCLIRRGITGLFAAGILLTAHATWAEHGKVAAVVDAKGHISLPEDFRQHMSHLGSWFVPEGDASGFHDVYMTPDAVSHFQAKGQFPNGAVIVKELRGHKTGNYTTGQNVAFAGGGLKQWFVMVKDTDNSYPDNPSWGDGWGWALFQPGKEGNVSNNYKTDCLGCHVPARSNDWIYVEAYPTLKR